jgi:hypothetical protein
MARKAAPFEAASSQMFCILTPDTPQAGPQLWAFTTFTSQPDAQQYLSDRLGRLGRSTEGFTIAPCEVSLRLTHL